jgi:hypothetical protein
MDISDTIVPRSDQLNADDLLAGPRIIRITAVNKVAGEQPIHLQYEGGTGRPYKPGKSMRRVLVSIWGSDGATYVGRRLALYCDKAVTFGPDTTGGIRISHASDIAEAQEMALTVKRGKRKPFRVEPLPAEKAATPPRAMDELRAAGDAISATGQDAYREWWTKGISAAERDLLGGPNGALHQSWKRAGGAS